jgi:large subunit ribosomal protein L20
LHQEPGEKRFLSRQKGTSVQEKTSSLWIQRINAGVRQYGMSYSQFIGSLEKKGIALNRKTLADLAMNHPDAFKTIVEKIK